MSSFIDNDFRNPDVSFRGKPFWALNGLLDKNEVCRQVRIFKEMGLAGAFMHARTGLDTPYLGKEWFDVVGAAIDEARKNGMEMWLYDEDRYPSGAAGGLVTKNPKHRMRYLQLNILDTLKGFKNKKPLAVFDVQYDGTAISSYRQVKNLKDAKLGDGHNFFVFEVKITENMSWYNGFTYLDTLSKEAVKEFIKVTHSAYAKHFKKDFGKTVPGIFTDEPNFFQRKVYEGKNYSAPWTDTLPKIFSKRYSYDILEHLPEIFFSLKSEVFSKARHDYFDTLTEMFSKSFAAQIGAFCEKNNILFTGHMLDELPLVRQMMEVGSMMRSLQYFQAPGVDVLFGQGITYRRGGSYGVCEYLTLKQCASLKDQFNRKWMMSELYGGAGWHFTLAEQKTVGDWQAALGVNMRCQHLAYYTMAGEAKRDYPPSIFYQSPWWKDYSIVEDYFARVNMLLSQGQAVKDIAVIHPIESLWGTMPLAASEKHWSDIDERFKKLTVLLEAHCDFDLVDEGILAEYGAVRNSKFCVAKAAYSLVMVLPVASIRKTTFEYLKKFRKSGGKVVFFEPLPSLLDGEKSEELEVFCKAEKVFHCNMDELPLAALENAERIRRVSISGHDGQEYKKCMYQLRHDAQNRRWILFICHTIQEQASGALSVRVPVAGSVREYDCMTGKIYDVEFKKDSASTVITTSLEAFGSRMFVIDEKATNSELAERIILKESSKIAFDSETWTIRRDEPNVFPLDWPEYAIGNSEYQPAKEILRIDNILRTNLKVPLRGDSMAQPWTVKHAEKSVSVPVSLRYRFNIDKRPFSPSYLILEHPADYKITLNGFLISSDDEEGWWLDKSFRKLKISPSLLKDGVNEIVLKTEYSAASGLECLFFAGEFGFKWVDYKPHIIELPDVVKAGDWAEYGFPTYTGAMTYVNSFSAENNSGCRYFINIPDWKGALLKVKVNGQYTGRIMLPPYEIDVTDFVKAGSNSVEIELISTRKNILGPLHYNSIYEPCTGPDAFKVDTCFTENYKALPYGIMAQPYISVKS